LVVFLVVFVVVVVVVVVVVAVVVPLLDPPLEHATKKREAATSAALRREVMEASLAFRLGRGRMER
jgi:hypothetical protein